MHEAKLILQNKGYKLTERRQEILEFFANTNRYKTAKDLHLHMQGIYEGISYDTVYRNLHLFNDLNILESTELDAEKLFRMKCSDQHHHHFICKTCGDIKKLDLCPMTDISNLLSGYQVDDHKFEVYGLCPECIQAS